MTRTRSPPTWATPVTGTAVLISWPPSRALRWLREACPRRRDTATAPEAPYAAFGPAAPAERGPQGGGAGPGARARLAQQPRLPAQPGRHGLRAGRAPRLRGQVGGGHHHELVRADGVDGDLPAGLGAAAHHEVHLVPVEQGA